MVAGHLVVHVLHLLHRDAQVGIGDPELIRLASGAMKPVLDYAKLELRHKEFGLQQRKFALLKARAAKADQAEQVANSDLTPEEKQRKMREIFGLV